MDVERGAVSVRISAAKMKTMYILSAAVSYLPPLPLSPLHSHFNILTERCRVLPPPPLPLSPLHSHFIILTVAAPCR